MTNSSAVASLLAYGLLYFGVAIFGSLLSLHAVVALLHLLPSPLPLPSPLLLPSPLPLPLPLPSPLFIAVCREVIRVCRSPCGCTQAELPCRLIEAPFSPVGVAIWRRSVAEFMMQRVSATASVAARR